MFGRECDPIGHLELITVTREETDIPEDESFRAVYILGFTYTAIIAITDDR